MIDDRKRAETVASTQKENGEREGKGKGKKSIGRRRRPARVSVFMRGKRSLDAECRTLSLFL